MQYGTINFEFHSSCRSYSGLGCCEKNYKTVENVAVLDHLLSDHCSIIINLDVKKKNIPINRCITSKNLKGIDIDQLRSDLRAIRTDDNELKALVDKHAPLVTRGVSDRPYAQWYDTDVKPAKCECRRAERLWLKRGLTPITSNVSQLKNNGGNERLRPLKRIITCLEYSNSRSCKQLFGICDDLLGRAKQSSLPSIYEDSALPNMFAVYFSEKV